METVVPGRKGFKGVRIAELGGRMSILVEVNTRAGWRECEAGIIDLGRKHCVFYDRSEALTHELIIAFLGTCYQFFLCGANGFLIHSSGVIKNGKAHIFAGPPGSGKSTMARLSEGLPVISDDFVCVKKVDGSYRAYATPWYGRDKNISAEIGRVFFIRHGRATSFEKLDPAESVMEILSNAYCTVLHGSLMRNVLELAAGLSGAAPSYRMSYFLQDPLWESLENVPV